MGLLGVRSTVRTSNSRWMSRAKAWRRAPTDAHVNRTYYRTQISLSLCPVPWSKPCEMSGAKLSCVGRPTSTGSMNWLDHMGDQQHPLRIRYEYMRKARSGAEQDRISECNSLQTQGWNPGVRECWQSPVGARPGTPRTSINLDRFSLNGYREGSQW